MVVKVALFTTYAALSSVLLAAQVAELDPVGKVTTLAAITSIGFVVTAITQPVAGALSDRTSTRFGRRLPWMASGAVVGGLAVGSMPGAPSVLLLAGLWIVVQFALHAVEVSADAYLVDAFPPARRGFAAGMTGLALVGGTAAGAVLAASHVTRPAIASWLLAGAVVLAVIIFAALVRDPASAPIERPKRTKGQAIRRIGRVFIEHPDFVKILLWRIGYSIAYGAVFAFLLYIVTDVVGLPTAEAAGLVAAATVLGSATAGLSVVIGGWLSDRVGRRRLFILVGNAVIIAGNILLLASPTPPIVLVTGALFGVGLGLSISCGRALASQVLPDPTGGAAGGLGLLSTAANIGQAAAPVIGAFAIGLGGYPAALVTSIAGAVLCSVAIALVRTVR